MKTENNARAKTSSAKNKSSFAEQNNKKKESLDHRGSIIKHHTHISNPITSCMLTNKSLSLPSDLNKSISSQTQKSQSYHAIIQCANSSLNEYGDYSTYLWIPKCKSWNDCGIECIKRTLQVDKTLYEFFSENFLQRKLMGCVVQQSCKNAIKSHLISLDIIFINWDEFDNTWVRVNYKPHKKMWWWSM